MKKAALLVVLALAFFAAAAQARDATDPSSVRLVQIASGFDRPLYVTHAGDGTGRLFVLEQSGKIKIVQTGVVLPTPFLDLSSQISRDVFSGQYTERGLLGLAFHPQYETNGVFFVDYTDLNGNTAVARYTVSASDPNVADPLSGQIILTVQQPYPNHNGGDLVFGPDGYLYIGLGDGGSAGDPNNNGQNPHALLGKILRIDVDGGTPYTIPADNPYTFMPQLAPEIWAWGLRNPWRFSFDRATGDLYIADVGQNAWEEVNFQPADSPGGENYGWRVYEATHPYSGEPPSADMVMPIAEYNHTEGVSITGGYVYRGTMLPNLQGVYFFGDFAYGTIWASYRGESNQWQTSVFMPRSGHTISSFGEDEQGELYLVDYTGSLWRFEPAG